MYIGFKAGLRFKFKSKGVYREKGFGFGIRVRMVRGY